VIDIATKKGCYNDKVSKAYKTRGIEKAVPFDITKEKSFKRRPKRLYLKQLGVKVFKIIKKHEQQTVNNNYSFASKQYVKGVNGWEMKKMKYKLIPFTIEIQYWYLRNYAGELADTTISETVWYNLIRLRDKIMKHKYEVGHNIIYWKKSFSMVWIAFLTDKRLEQLLPILYEFDHRDDFKCNNLKRVIPWYGNKAVFSLKDFKQFYGGN